MMRRRYQPTANTRHFDTEALHTDVMRFMAILGLCLTAVFALVQTIPHTETPPTRSSPEDTARLEERKRELEQSASQLAKRLEDTLARHAGIEEALARNLGVLEKTRAEVERAEERRNRLQAQLHFLGTKLAAKRETLKQTSRAPTPKISSIDQPAEPLVPKPRPAPPPQPAVSAAEDATAAAPEPGAAGFTLRFASDSALNQLVGKGSVRLLGISGSQAWLLSIDQGQPNFAPHGLPGSFHEMTPSTVPAAYVRALHSRRDAPAATGLVWGVELPPDVERRISRLLHSAAGGALIIHADGGVDLETIDQSG